MKMAKNTNYDNTKCPKASLKYFILAISGVFLLSIFWLMFIWYPAVCITGQWLLCLIETPPATQSTNNWKTALSEPHARNLTLKIVK